MRPSRAVCRPLALALALALPLTADGQALVNGALAAPNLAGWSSTTSGASSVVGNDCGSLFGSSAGAGCATVTVFGSGAGGGSIAQTRPGSEFIVGGTYLGLGQFFLAAENTGFTPFLTVGGVTALGTHCTVGAVCTLMAEFVFAGATSVEFRAGATRALVEGETFGTATAAIDNLALTTQAVPEPSTWALLGTGFAVLLGAARRRQRTT